MPSSVRAWTSRLRPSGFTASTPYSVSHLSRPGGDPTGGVRAPGATVAAVNTDDRNSVEFGVARSIGRANGQVTTGLLNGVRYLKDNRVLPHGFEMPTLVHADLLVPQKLDEVMGGLHFLRTTCGDANDQVRRVGTKSEQGEEQSPVLRALAIGRRYAPPIGRIGRGQRPCDSCRVS